MRSIVNGYVERFRSERKTRVRFAAILLILALLLAAVVFWQLRYTGIAMANDVNCGLEEHIHTEECYALVLTCDRETAGLSAHTHDASCYEEVKTLVCDRDHDHDDGCYATEQVPICGLEESTAGHVHDASCYEEVLVCDLPEHVHTAACMSNGTADAESAADWEATLPEELTGVWADDVVAVAESQIGYAESERNFTLAEDGETRNGYTRYGAWYGNAYGDWDAMFVSFCLRYAGVDEELFPQAAGAWAWVMDLTISEETDESEPGEEAETTQRYADAAEYRPVPGDLVFFDTNEDGEADRVGIVTALTFETDEEAAEQPTGDAEIESEAESETDAEADEETVISLTVIEGDCDDAVRENDYAPDDGTILGYGLLPANPDAAGEEPEEVEPEESEEVTLTCEGEGYLISVTYGPAAELPEDVVLYAYEYEKDSETYQARYAEAAELNGRDAEEREGDDTGEDIRLFRVGLYVCRTDEDGETAYTEVEPAVPVTVTITYLTENGESTSGAYTVTHFGEEKTETIAAEVTRDEEATDISFELDGFSDIMVLAAGNGTIVFSWSNENNLATDWGGDLYSGGYNGGGRAEVDVSAAATNGSVTITLPEDKDLTGTAANPNNFTLCSYTQGQGPQSQTRNITVPLTSIDSNYNYKLVGWYDLYDGEYYEPGQQITINVASAQHVFYADTVAASYNAGSKNDSDLLKETDKEGNTTYGGLSTRDFVTVELYDYNELFNLYSTSVTYEEGNRTDTAENSGEVFRDTGSLYSKPASISNTTTQDSSGENVFSRTDTNNLISNISSFTFKYNNIARQDNGVTDYQSSIFYPYGLKDWNEWDGNYNLKNAATVWNMGTDTDNDLLNMLFPDPNDNDTALGVHYVGTADNLFQYGTGTYTSDLGNTYDFKGYYYYSSELNAAAYSQSDERFYLYDKTEHYADNDYSMFLPFNSYADFQQNGTGTNDLNVNYYFGMKMEVDFFIPNDVDNPNKINGPVDVTDSGTGSYTERVGNVDENKNDLVFNFSGDDDIMIYIDDKLVLDMSGIHYEAHGSINFNTGVVTKRNGKNTSDDNYTESTYISGLNLKSGEHTLTVYYLERGTGYSNLTVSFNITPEWEYETGPLQTIYAEKDWTYVNGARVPDTDTDLFASVDFGLFEQMAYETTTDNDGETVYTITEDHYYNNSKTYKEKTYTIGENGYSTDDDGLVNAYLATEINSETGEEETVLYVRVAIHTMSYNDEGTDYIDPSTGVIKTFYGWYYTWELLEPEGVYAVRELTEGTAYTADIESARQEDGFYYWTIIGEKEVEEMVLEAGVYDSDGNLTSVTPNTTVGQIILTDAAQHIDASGVADTSDNTGYVVIVSEDETTGNKTITTEKATFSQAADVTRNESTGQVTYSGTYGAVGGNEIANLDGNAVWYVETTGDTVKDTNGETIHLFRLYYFVADENGTDEVDKVKGTKWYLSEPAVELEQDHLEITDNVDEAGEFYDDAMGELRIHYSALGENEDASGSKRVCFDVRTDSDGTEYETLVVESAKSEDDGRNVKIYSWNAGVGSGYVFTINNVVNPDLTIEKEDTYGNALAGAQFRLSRTETVTDENGTTTNVTYYYQYNAPDEGDDTETGEDNDNPSASGEEEGDKTSGSTATGVADRVRWVEEPSEATPVTTEMVMETVENAESGKEEEVNKARAVFHYLPDGDYTLEEVVAPEGYASVGVITFTIENGLLVLKTEDNESAILVNGTPSDLVTGSNNASYGTDDNTGSGVLLSSSVVITIKDVTATELPHTGGIGTVWYTAVGLALVCGAAGLIVNRRRKTVRGGQ